MKKHIAAALIATLCLLFSVSALAENIIGQGSMTAKNGELAAYLNGDGDLMIPGNDQPVNQHTASSIISIDPYRIVYTSREVFEDGSEQNALITIDLSTMTERVWDTNVHDACPVGSEKLYYISAADRTQLYVIDFEREEVRLAYSSAEAFDRLFVSAEGPVATYVEDAGAVIYVAATDSFEPFGEPIPARSTMTADYQVYITTDDTMYIRRPGSLAPDAIDMDVLNYALLNDQIYYLANMGSALRLKVYDPVQMSQRVVATPDIPLTSQIAASQNALFVLGTDNVIYSVDLQNGQLNEFAFIPAPAAGDTYAIEAASGILNVYVCLAEEAEVPEFSFMEFSSDITSENRKMNLVASYALDGESPAWTLLEPAKPFTPLKRGSRGSAIADIQQPLYNHGYYDYYIDGIFGYRTENAVRLLQGDLGLTVTGIADENLQKIILSENFPYYDPYVELNRGDRGLRVTQMQRQLRKLGYLADGADGIFGIRTQAAVQLFQRENNLTVSKSATRDTLILLYDPTTPACSSYIDLYPGDSGYRVRALNKRLKDLYYLQGGVDDTYTSATSEAVRRFQAQVGLNITGEATASLQQRLFAPNAPESSGYIELRRGDENSRVAQLQRRLKELNYFHGPVTGYYGHLTQDAVTLFQQKVGIRANGVASVRMQEILYSPSAPIYIKPTKLSVPSISMSPFEKRENGIYYVTDETSETGHLTFSWSVEGEVAEYEVSITDESNRIYLDQNTRLNMLSVPVSLLEMDRVYALNITAHPADGNPKQITSNFIRFSRIEVPEEPEEDQVGTITNVFTSIDPVSRIEDDIYYVQPGTISFRWFAEGDVQSYYVEILDSKNNVMLSASTNDEQASILSDLMAEGEVYTLSVSAIPTNGTIEDAVVKTQKFALDNAPLPTVDAPTVTVEGLTPDENGIYTLEGTSATLQWNAVENAEQYYVEVRTDTNAFCFSNTTTATGYVMNISSLPSGANYFVSVSAIPAGGKVEAESTTTLSFRIPQTEPVVTLDPPTVSIAGVKPAQDGIYYVDQDSVNVQWTAVSGAASYNVVVRDSYGTGAAEESTTELTTSYPASMFTADAVYSISVTGVPDENSAAQGTSQTISVIVKSKQVPSLGSSMGVTPLVEIEAPELSISPIAESSSSMVYVLPGELSFTWHSEGNVSEYYVEIVDELGNTYPSMTTQNQSGQLDSELLPANRIFTLRVTAIPENGTLENGKTSELTFAMYVEPAEPTEAPAEPTEAPVEPTETPAEPTEAPAEPTEAPVEPTEAPAEPTEAPAEAAEISAPMLNLADVAETVDSISYVNDGEVVMNWFSEGNVAKYHAELWENDIQLGVIDSDETQAVIKSSSMNPDSIYTLKVTAIPVNGTPEDGLTSEIAFALYVEKADESMEQPTPQPTEEPTPVPTEEPTPVPTEEPTPVPTEEPTPVPTEEPTPVPTEEPTPVPTEEPTPVPTEEPTPVPTEEPAAMDDPLSVPMDVNSDPMLITQLQDKLVELGWLVPDTYSVGLLDEATINAVNLFQQDFNANYGGNLELSTIENPIIGVDTLLALVEA